MSGSVTSADAASVPSARVDVVVANIDRETVIYRAGDIHVLDPIATLVWTCCDGEASVGAIAAELADVFSIPEPTIRRDVGAVVARLTELGLLEDSPGPDTRGAAGPSPEVLADPPGSCASCAEREWRFVRTYRVGRRLVGVGTDSERADVVLRGVLLSHFVAARSSESESPPFFAVTLPPRSPGVAAPTQLNLVHRGEAVTARSRRPDRVMRALISQIATYGDLTKLGLAAVNGVVVARGDRAVIVPEPVDAIRYRHELARRGLHVADVPVALVDAPNREAVVGAPGLAIDAAPLEALADASEGLGRDSEPDALPWGRYRIVAFGLRGDPTPAAALLTFGPLIDDHRDHPHALAALVELLRAVPVVDAVRPDAIDALLARA